MTKQQILDHPGFQYISSLSLKNRYYALFVSPNQEAIRNAYNATIREYPFDHLSSVGEDDITLSMLNGDKASMAVIHPLDNQ